jgi:pimeloyl-ACP methyl ester carboxylesterase
MSDIMYITADRFPAPAFDRLSFDRVFQSGSVRLDGVGLHYVQGGEGAPVLLIPGWPQSWFAWRYVMPLLVAQGRSVIAIDPRGMGDSDHPANGYDMSTVAREVRAFIKTLGLDENGPIDVVGHDIGTWIGYALAADWPDCVRSLALFDGAIPGVTPPPPAGIPTEEINDRTWHFAFNRLNDLPEILIAGRERPFLEWLFRAKSINGRAITPGDMDEYVRVNSLPGALRAAFSYYRTVISSDGLAENRQRAETKLEMPVLAFGAEFGVGEALFKTVRTIADDCRGGVFLGSGHYMPEETPEALVSQLTEFYHQVS